MMKMFFDVFIHSETKKMRIGNSKKRFAITLFFITLICSSDQTPNPETTNPEKKITKMSLWENWF